MCTPAILHPNPGDLTQSSSPEYQALLWYTRLHSDKALICIKFSKRKEVIDYVVLYLNFCQPINKLGIEQYI